MHPDPEGDRSVTARADFASEEWELLLKAPYSVAYAVITASMSGFVGMVRELAVIGMALEEATDGESAAELPRAVAADLAAGASERAEASASAEDHAQALETCRAVARLLAAKVPPAEAEAFARWLVSLGRQVANASKEGGFLGMGGSPVSAEETAILTRIAEALGTTTS
jgi:hypothetical protein